jgi:hypothetical protein
MTTFSAPAAPGATGDKFDIKAHNGALLLIDVNGLKEQVETVHGPADAIACNIAVLDGEHKGDEYDDTLVFPRVLVGQLKSSIGKLVLARLGQGEKKPGKGVWEGRSYRGEEWTADALTTWGQCSLPSVRVA